MKKLAIGFLSMIAIATPAAESAAQAALPVPPDMEIVDLGTLGGKNSYALAINNKGQVVGYSETVDGKEHAFLWERGKGMTDLGVLSGMRFSFATAINEAGQIIGTSCPVTCVDWTSPMGEFKPRARTNNGRAFLWEGASLTDLGTLGWYTSPKAINERGEIVGTSWSEQARAYRAFRWSDGAMEDLGSISPGDYQATAINDSGSIVGGGSPQYPGVPFGFSGGDFGAHTGFIWEGTMDDLGSLGGPEPHQAIAWDINNEGQVVGASTAPDALRAHYRPFLWSRDGGMVELVSTPPFGYLAWAEGINEHGEVFGYYFDQGYKGFFWKDGVTQRLSHLVGANNYPTAINDRSEVVGYRWRYNPLGFSAFIWKDGVMTDLGTLAGVNAKAYDANDLGVIVGWSEASTTGCDPMFGCPKHAVLWAPLPAEKRIEGLIEFIQSLVSGGSLEPGPGIALVVSLEAALKKLEDGNTNTACNTLEAFANKVQAFMNAGTLSPTDGEALLREVNKIIAQLCG